MSTDILVLGGGLGGVAAALAALRAGRRVVLVEELEWLGGQLTAQAVPPDEHPRIEQFGATRSYRVLRDRIRDYYRRNYPVEPRFRDAPDLNPGAGLVSRLAHEPRVAAAVIDELIAPWRASGQLVLLRGGATSADTEGDRVRAVTVAGAEIEWCIEAQVVIDATETGELLPLAEIEYVTGFEAQADTGEPSAPETAQPQNMQAISWCYALDHVDGDRTIDKPEMYEFWRDYAPDFWGGPLLSWTSPDPRTLQPVTRGLTPNPGDPLDEIRALQQADPSGWDLWRYRRILAKDTFEPGRFTTDVTMVNWPSIDYFAGSIIDVPDAERERNLEQARQLSLSKLYWMQTEAPRSDGGVGYPGLGLRPDIMGTDDGLAMAPYIRESRRIRAVTTVTENDVSVAVRGGQGTRHYADSVGIGMYRIDIHPTTGMDHYLDIASTPFEIPLGMLLPRRVRNVIAGAKNVGSTHITNGCYRLHPVEWNIGEAAGALAAFCLDNRVETHQVHADPSLTRELQRRLELDGIELRWPADMSAS